MILRTYQCPECNHRIEVELTQTQWNDPAPDCPVCQAREMGQIFRPPMINGSPSARANAIAEKIAEEDYGVSNIHRDHREGSAPKVAYRDDMMGIPKREGRNWANSTQSTWGVNDAAMQQAMASGKAIRKQFGSGLDVLQSALKTGAQPDLIAASKQRAMKIW